MNIDVKERVLTVTNINLGKQKKELLVASYGRNMNRHIALLICRLCNPDAQTGDLQIGLRNLQIGLRNLQIGLRNLQIGLRNLQIRLRNLQIVQFSIPGYFGDTDRNQYFLIAFTVSSLICI